MSQVNTITIGSQEAETTPISLCPTTNDRSKPTASRYNIIPEAIPRSKLAQELNSHSEETGRLPTPDKSIISSLKLHVDGTGPLSNPARQQSDKRPVDRETLSTSTASGEALTQNTVLKAAINDTSSVEETSPPLNESGPSLVDEASLPTPAAIVQKPSSELIPPQSDDYSDLRKRPRVVPVLRGSLPEGRPQHVRNITDLVRRVGQAKIDGGCSTIYTGDFENKKVAIKSIRGSNNVEQHVIYRRFWRETWTWWCLHHENILPLYGYADSEEFGIYPAMISPWCDNGHSKEYLGQNPGMEHRVRVFHDIVRGVKYLHEHEPGIAHGDLKPSNVLVDAEGTAKLCDLGLVRLIHQTRTETTTTTSHTGSARYLSPELLIHDNEANEGDTQESSEQDRTGKDNEEGQEEIFRSSMASDIFALGSVGVELLYDFPPYQRISGRNRPDYHIANAIIEGELPAIRPSGPSGQGLDAVVCELWDTFEWCWMYSPDERLSAGELCSFLDRSHDALVERLAVTHGQPTSKSLRAKKTRF